MVLVVHGVLGFFGGFFLLTLEFFKVFPCLVLRTSGDFWSFWALLFGIFFLGFLKANP